MYLLRVLGETAGEVRDVLRASTPTHGRLCDRLVAIALATVGFDMVCAVLAFLFEHHQQQTQINSLGSALFWRMSGSSWNFDGDPRLTVTR
jgi:hypothetical protein